MDITKDEWVVIEEEDIWYNKELDKIHCRRCESFISNKKSSITNHLKTNIHKGIHNFNTPYSIIRKRNLWDKII